MRQLFALASLAAAMATSCQPGWYPASWTYYDSYAACCPNNPNYDPKAPKEECEDYSACKYAGDFAYVNHKSFDWVKSHDIVAFFTTGKNNSRYGKRSLRIQAHGKTLQNVLIADTCGDDDCSGCCTKNARPSGHLIDMEYWTVMRHFGNTDLVDGQICWQLLESDLESSATSSLPSSPAPLPSEIIGYYSWNWGSGSVGPAGANAGCAFTGLIGVADAIKQYSPGASWCCPELKGTKYLSLGGGNSAGVFTASALKDIISSGSQIKAGGYDAVMFDVEEVSGASNTMVPLFAQAFAALKKAGLIVAITTSHSAPYQCDSAEDAVAFVKAWVADANVDILSPQLYSSGQETAPDFAETNSCKDAGCAWNLYKGAKAAIAPSIVHSTQYSAVKTWFSSNQGIRVRGYFEWAQRAGQERVMV